MNITLWWPIDPWLNLFASLPAMLLAFGTIALAALGRWLTIEERRRAARLLCGAVLIALAIVYVLAADPKPRMFMTAFAALSIVSGAAIARGLRTEARVLAAALLLMPVLAGLYVMSRYPTSAPAEAQARQWIARYGEDIELSPGAASYLTLVPEARGLPQSGSGRRYLVATSAVECAKLIAHRPGGGDGAVVGQVHVQGYLCLFEYLPVRPSRAR